MGIEYDEDGNPYLHGRPEFCPVCRCDSLKVRPMPDITIGECHWYCANCGIEWEVGDLIDVLMETT